MSGGSLQLVVVTRVERVGTGTERCTALSLPPSGVALTSYTKFTVSGARCLDAHANLLMYSVISGRRILSAECANTKLRSELAPRRARAVPGAEDEGMINLLDLF